MNWDAVAGRCGRAHFKARSYKTSGGEERFTNDVAEFYDYKPEFFTGPSTDATMSAAGLRAAAPVLPGFEKPQPFVPLTDDNDGLPF